MSTGGATQRLPSMDAVGAKAVAAHLALTGQLAALSELLSRTPDAISGDRKLELAAQTDSPEWVLSALSYDGVARTDIRSFVMLCVEMSARHALAKLLAVMPLLPDMWLHEAEAAARIGGDKRMMQLLHRKAQRQSAQPLKHD